MQNDLNRSKKKTRFPSLSYFPHPLTHPLGVTPPPRIQTHSPPSAEKINPARHTHTSILAQAAQPSQHHITTTFPSEKATLCIVSSESSIIRPIFCSNVVGFGRLCRARRVLPLALLHTDRWCNGDAILFARAQYMW